MYDTVRHRVIARHMRLIFGGACLDNSNCYGGIITVSYLQFA
jgi:hypothetical protein